MVSEQEESLLVKEKAKAALLDKVHWTTVSGEKDKDRVSRIMDYNTPFDHAVADQVLLMLRKSAITKRFSEDERLPDAMKYFPLDDEAEKRAHIEFFTGRAGIFPPNELLVIKVDRDVYEAARKQALGKGKTHGNE